MAIITETVRRQPDGRMHRFRLSSPGWMRLSGGILILLVIAGTCFPRAELWGVHFLAFLPPVVAVILLAAAAMLLTPVGSRVIAWLRRARWQRIPTFIWIVLAFAMFVTLRVREPLLGDGQALLRHLEAIGRFDARGLPYVDKGQARWAEPLETWLHETVYRTAAAFHPPVPADFSPTESEEDVWTERMWFFETARWTYVILSAAAGAILCLLLLQFAKRMLPEPRRAVFLLGIFGTGAMLTFFGYVEDYAWASVAAAGCVLAAIEDYSNPQRWPWRTAVWWAVALLMHMLTLFLLPLVAYLFLVRQYPALKREPHPQRISRIGWLVFLLFVILFSAFAPEAVRRYVIVLTGVGPYQGYPFLSLRHVADLANLLWLLVPLIPLGVSFGLWLRHRPDNFRVLQLACAGGIGFAVLFDPRLGGPRDWDLMSVAFWPLIIATAWVLAQQPWGSRRDSLLAALTAGILLIPVPFVLVNARAESEVSRMEIILAHDPARSAYGWENVAAYYRRQHDPEHTIEALKHSVAVDANTHYAVNLASELRRAGRLEEAEPLYFGVAEKRPDLVKNLLFLAQSYARRGDSQKARDVVAKANSLDPGNPIYVRLLFQLDSLAGDTTTVR